MKRLAVIWSMYLVLLACLPCADVAPSERTAEVTCLASRASSSDQTPAADLCSPLCICNCCAGFALQTSLPKISLSVFSTTTPAPVHRQVALVNPSFAIWQPPKL